MRVLPRWRQTQATVRVWDNGGRGAGSVTHRARSACQSRALSRPLPPAACRRQEDSILVKQIGITRTDRKEDTSLALPTPGLQPRYEEFALVGEFLGQLGVELE